MKTIKKIILMVSMALLASAAAFAQNNVPALDDGNVISLREYSDSFRDKIMVINYSSLTEIDIDFYIYKDSDWKNIGKISKCPLGEDSPLITKEKFKKIDYVAYKSSSLSDKRVYVDIRNHDLKLFILETSNTFFGSAKSFSDIRANQSIGIYKLDTDQQRRNYEDNLRVENAPKSIIMFQAPDSGSWDVYGIVENGKLRTFYGDDIDDYAPYWIIQVLDEYKYYNISAYAKHSDLYFKFVKTEPDNSKTDDAAYGDIEEQLIKLKTMYDKGLIDESEYKEKKSKILGI